MEREPRYESVEELLEEARAKLPGRLSPEQAVYAMEHGATLVDIRYLQQRERDGTIPGALIVNRNEFEWRCHPASEWRDPQIAPNDYEQCLIVICNQGYSSSLAAAILQDFGLKNATDVEGGFEAWKAAGMPWVPQDSS